MMLYLLFIAWDRYSIHSMGLSDVNDDKISYICIVLYDLKKGKHTDKNRILNNGKIWSILFRKLGFCVISWVFSPFLGNGFGTLDFVSKQNSMNSTKHSKGRTYI